MLYFVYKLAVTVSVSHLVVGREYTVAFSDHFPLKATACCGWEQGC